MFKEYWESKRKDKLLDNDRSKAPILYQWYPLAYPTHIYFLFIIFYFDRILVTFLPLSFLLFIYYTHVVLTLSRFTRTWLRVSYIHTHILFSYLSLSL
jgi:hypothetical protein